MTLSSLRYHMSKSTAYHHGNLRAVLLEQGQTLLRSEGVDGLSLRKLGERAGVSRMAPYHHFGDKHGLLCALATRGFEELDALMEPLRQDQLSPTVVVEFVQSYLRFATLEPERYELMFGRRIWKLAQPTPELRRTAYATFKAYTECMGRLNPRLSSTQALRLAQASWATVHGLCRLQIDGVYVDADDMAEVSRVAVQRMFRDMGH